MANPSSFYGKYVTNYNSLSDEGIKDETGQFSKWQIFLADDSNIFLIASNRISKDYAPFNYTSEKDYCMYFNNDILNQYDTNLQQNPKVSDLLDRLDKKNKYHEWIFNASLNNNKNQKAVLSMLDTNKWSQYI